MARYWRAQGRKYLDEGRKYLALPEVHVGGHSAAKIRENNNGKLPIDVHFVEKGNDDWKIELTFADNGNETIETTTLEDGLMKYQIWLLILLETRVYPRSRINEWTEIYNYIIENCRRPLQGARYSPQVGDFVTFEDPTDAQKEYPLCIVTIREAMPVGYNYEYDTVKASNVRVMHIDHENSQVGELIRPDLYVDGWVSERDIYLVGRKDPNASDKENCLMASALGYELKVTLLTEELHGLKDNENENMQQLIGKINKLISQSLKFKNHNINRYSSVFATIPQKDAYLARLEADGVEFETVNIVGGFEIHAEHEEWIKTHGAGMIKKTRPGHGRYHPVKAIDMKMRYKNSNKKMVFHWHVERCAAVTDDEDEAEYDGEGYKKSESVEY